MSAATNVLTAWGLEGASCLRLGSGHINQTWRVDAPAGSFALQRLSRIFGAEVNHDIAAVTAELARQGLLTPHLVPTASGELWHTEPAGDVWRLMSWIEGRTLLSADSPGRCAEAGRLLGRFHRALWGCEHRFQHRRPGVHDTSRHLDNLECALVDHVDHRLGARIEPVARRILEQALELPHGLPERVVHGDPKISNVIFAEDGEALALVDLDTLARMALPLELGDALRSWCAPQGEEVEGPVDLAHFEAALRGYAEGVGALPTAAERRSIPRATELIAVELAARFCADALQERYFGWDAGRFASAAEHNLVRARAQLSLARSIHEHRDRMEQVVEQAWR